MPKKNWMVIFFFVNRISVWNFPGGPDVCWVPIISTRSLRTARGPHFVHALGSSQSPVGPRCGRWVSCSYNTTLNSWLQHDKPQKSYRIQHVYTYISPIKTGFEASSRYLTSCISSHIYIYHLKYHCYHDDGISGWNGIIGISSTRFYWYIIGWWWEKNIWLMQVIQPQSWWPCDVTPRCLRTEMRRKKVEGIS